MSEAKTDLYNDGNNRVFIDDGKIEIEGTINGKWTRNYTVGMTNSELLERALMVASDVIRRLNVKNDRLTHKVVKKKPPYKILAETEDYLYIYDPNSETFGFAIMMGAKWVSRLVKPSQDFQTMWCCIAKLVETIDKDALPFVENKYRNEIFREGEDWSQAEFEAEQHL